MQNQTVAFVIKNHFPLQQKITMITQQHGKITALAKQPALLQKVPRGSFLAYTASSLYNSHIVIESTEVILPPTANSQESIYWLHHLLELCYYFIPEASPNDHFFEWILNFSSLLYAAQVHNISLAIHKKIYILYFFELIGIATTPLQERHYSLIMTINRFLENNDRFSLNTLEPLLEYNHNEHKTLNNRILKELRGHPCFEQFKTVRFVYSI